MDEPAQEPQQYCLRWNNHQSTIVSIFDTLYRTEALVDCQIAVEGGIVYKAHRVVLSACSPYFADLLKTYNEQMYPTIVVCGIGANEIEAIMSYMYRGEVNISQERLPSLLRIAEFLKIKGLSESNASRGTAHHQQQPQQLPGNPNKRQRISSVPGIESEAAGQDEAISPRRRRRGIRRRSHDNNDNSNSSAVQDSLVHHNAPGSAQLGTISLTGNASTASAYSAMPHYAAASLGLSASALSAQAPLASSPLSVSVTKKTESGKSGTGAASDTTNVQTAKLANAAIDEHNQDSAITKNTVDKSSSSAANHQKLSKSATLASGSNTASSNNNREPSTSAAAAQLGTEMVIEPKAEYVEDANEENVEDLTLDDEDMATGMDDMDQAAGTSQAGEGSSQGYANWQHERSNQDDLVLATQEGQQRDPQVVLREVNRKHRNTVITGRSSLAAPRSKPHGQGQVVEAEVGGVMATVVIKSELSDDEVEEQQRRLDTGVIQQHYYSNGGGQLGYMKRCEDYSKAYSDPSQLFAASYGRASDSELDEDEDVDYDNDSHAGDLTIDVKPFNDVTGVGGKTANGKSKSRSKSCGSQPAILPTDETGARYACQVCGKTYMRTRHLQRHSREECIAVEPRFRCHDCQNTYRRRYHMTNHLQKAHLYSKAEAERLATEWGTRQPTERASRRHSTLIGGVGGKASSSGGSRPCSVDRMIQDENQNHSNITIPQNLSVRKEENASGMPTPLPSPVPSAAASGSSALMSLMPSNFNLNGALSGFGGVAAATLAAAVERGASPASLGFNAASPSQYMEAFARVAGTVNLGDSSPHAQANSEAWPYNLQQLLLSSSAAQTQGKRK